MQIHVFQTSRMTQETSSFPLIPSPPNFHLSMASLGPPGVDDPLSHSSLDSSVMFPTTGTSTSNAISSFPELPRPSRLGPSITRSLSPSSSEYSPSYSSHCSSPDYSSSSPDSTYPNELYSSFPPPDIPDMLKRATEAALKLHMERLQRDREELVRADTEYATQECERKQRAEAAGIWTVASNRSLFGRLGNRRLRTNDILGEIARNEAQIRLILGHSDSTCSDDSSPSPLLQPPGYIIAINEHKDGGIPQAAVDHDGAPTTNCSLVRMEEGVGDASIGQIINPIQHQPQGTEVKPTLNGATINGSLASMEDGGRRDAQINQAFNQYQHRITRQLNPAHNGAPTMNPSLVRLEEDGKREAHIRLAMHPIQHLNTPQVSPPLNITPPYQHSSVRPFGTAAAINGGPKTGWSLDRMDEELRRDAQIRQSKLQHQRQGNLQDNLGRPSMHPYQIQRRENGPPLAVSTLNSAATINCSLAGVDELRRRDIIQSLHLNQLQRKGPAQVAPAIPNHPPPQDIKRPFRVVPTPNGTSTMNIFRAKMFETRRQCAQPRQFMLLNQHQGIPQLPTPSGGPKIDWFAVDQHKITLRH